MISNLALNTVGLRLSRGDLRVLRGGISMQKIQIIG
jgi:hypothetical protein